MACNHSPLFAWKCIWLVINILGLWKVHYSDYNCLVFSIYLCSLLSGNLLLWCKPFSANLSNILIKNCWIFILNIKRVFLGYILSYVDEFFVWLIWLWDSHVHWFIDKSFKVQRSSLLLKTSIDNTSSPRRNVFTPPLCTTPL